jgi:hypothetical protein
MIAIKRVNILLFYEIIFQFILLCRKIPFIFASLDGAARNVHRMRRETNNSSLLAEKSDGKAARRTPHSSPCVIRSPQFKILQPLACLGLDVIHLRCLQYHIALRIRCCL